jgi:cytochrome b561
VLIPGLARDSGNADGAITRVLLRCGELAGPLFIVTFVIEGARREGYLPRRHPVSALSLGESGWTQKLSFLVTGTLTSAFAFGVRRTLQPGHSSAWVTRMVGAIGCGLLGAGVFTTDPVNGYPPGSADVPAVRTRTGHLHDLSAVLVFAAVPAACLAYSLHCVAERDRTWAGYSATTGVAFTTAWALAAGGFKQAAPQLVENSGLFQRVAIVTGFSCMSALAARLASQLTTSAADAVAASAPLSPPNASDNTGTRRSLARLGRLSSRVSSLRPRMAEPLPL